VRSQDAHGFHKLSLTWVRQTHDVLSHSPERQRKRVGSGESWPSPPPPKAALQLGSYSGQFVFYNVPRDAEANIQVAIDQPVANPEYTLQWDMGATS